MTRRIAGPVALGLAASLAGCGLGAGPKPEGVTLRITQERGADPLHTVDRPRVQGEDTVMRLTQRNARVGTAFGGGFVDAIDGRTAGEDDDGRTRDWHFYVDGVLADRGATALRVRPGQDVWWDRHESRLGETGAVVGAFPRPLSARPGGVPLECARPRDRACRAAARALRAAGVPVRPRPVTGPGPRGTARVLVGTWAQVTSDATAGRLARGPRASGVLGGPTRAGFVALDPRGRPAAPVRRWGLVAALAPRGQGATWVVTGDGPRGTWAAARALRTDALRGRFAVLVRRDRVSGLPRASGR